MLFIDSTSQPAERAAFYGEQIIKIATENQLSQTVVFEIAGIPSRTYLNQLVRLHDHDFLLGALAKLNKKYPQKTDLQQYKADLKAQYGPNIQLEAENGATD